MTLYDIDLGIMECVDQETGEVIDIEKLQALEMERDSKISGIACWIKNLKAEAEAIKAEKQNLAKRQQVAENKAESLKEYLSAYLNGAKYKDARVSISYRKSTTVEIDEDVDLKTLPEDCQKITIEPRKTVLKEKLEDGQEFDGVRLVENSNIQIR